MPSLAKLIKMSQPKCQQLTSKGLPCRYNAHHEYDGMNLCGCHLKAIKAKEDCSICLCPMDNPNERIKVSPCNHYFHTACLKKCEKLQCPLCRATPSSKTCQVIMQDEINTMVNTCFEVPSPEDKINALYTMTNISQLYHEDADTSRMLSYILSRLAQLVEMGHNNQQVAASTKQLLHSCASTINSMIDYYEQQERNNH